MVKINVGDICYYHASYCAVTRIKQVGGLTTVSLMFQDGGVGEAFITDDTPYEYHVLPTGTKVDCNGVSRIIRQILDEADKEHPELERVIRWHEHEEE